MSYGPIVSYSGVVASGASTVSFQLPKAFSKVFVELSTMSTQVAFDIYGATEPAGTYRQVFERVNTAPVQYQSLTVASGVGANAGAAPIDCAYPNIQLRGSAVVSGGVNVKLICWD